MEQEPQSGTRRGTKFEQEPTRMGTKWEQSGNRNFKWGKNGNKVGTRRVYHGISCPFPSILVEHRAPHVMTPRGPVRTWYSIWRRRRGAKFEQEPTRMATKWEQEPQSGNTNGNKVGTRTPGKKVRRRTQKRDKNGNKVGPKWEQEP